METHAQNRRPGDIRFAWPSGQPPHPSPFGVAQFRSCGRGFPASAIVGAQDQGGGNRLDVMVHWKAQFNESYPVFGVESRTENPSG